MIIVLSTRLDVPQRMLTGSVLGRLVRATHDVRVAQRCRAADVVLVAVQRDRGGVCFPPLSRFGS